jgi:hypothetical protein
VDHSFLRNYLCSATVYEIIIDSTDRLVFIIEFVVENIEEKTRKTFYTKLQRKLFPEQIRLV